MARTAHRKATGRPSVKNTIRNKPSYRTKTYSVLNRLCVINAARDDSYNSALDTYFPGLTGTPRKTAWKRIHRWEQNRAVLEAAAAEPSQQHKKSLRPAGTSSTLDVAAEEGLAAWVNELRSEGIPVTNLLLQLRALEVARDVGLTAIQFKASPSWINGFMKRWRFSMRSKSRSGQADLAQGQVALEAFGSRVRALVLEHGIESIYNADQTGINYEYIPKKTIDSLGAKTVWIKGSGHDKDRLSAMLLADSNGVKYPLFLVLKTGVSRIKGVVQDNLKHRNGFGCHVWEDIEELHERHPSRIYGNPTAWWNSLISIEFLTYHFGYRRGTACKPVLLLWDAFSAHSTPDVLALASELNVLLDTIPPTLTWICQPADVAWMRSMKAALRHRWIEHSRTEVNNHDGGPFKLTPPDRFDIVEWVNTAWDSLSKKTIINGFRKCNIVDTPIEHERTGDADVDLDAVGAASVLDAIRHLGAMELAELDPALDVDVALEDLHNVS
ncbi:hypothetical protein DYB35_009403 [Aphanomyces astaci]|uniref:HTH CENPB-type domain-containing protein n=1 Tax=Aphanomyces astaci TaxID=112090 RepID=A0A418CP64_APHAT|nr:hypothetical protein DYB35_009403 [Aphanomyces astaci]